MHAVTKKTEKFLLFLSFIWNNGNSRKKHSFLSHRIQYIHTHTHTCSLACREKTYIEQENNQDWNIQIQTASKDNTKQENMKRWHERERERERDKWGFLLSGNGDEIAMKSTADKENEGWKKRKGRRKTKESYNSIVWTTDNLTNLCPCRITAVTKIGKKQKECLDRRRTNKQDTRQRRRTKMNQNIEIKDLKLKKRGKTRQVDSQKKRFYIREFSFAGNDRCNL